MGHRKIKAGVVLVWLLLTLALVLSPSLHARQSDYNPEYYPCSKCHTKIIPPATVNVSKYHNINLTVGAHKGLQCINCHNPDTAMMTMKNGVPLAILGLNTTKELMNLNKLCAQCHMDIYELYNAGAHGNSTYECPNGETLTVIGVNGVKYYQHLCDKHNYTRVPKEPCVKCHDPHNPTMHAISILPPPSDRPEPPNQDYITITGVAVFFSGLTLIALSPILYKKQVKG
jgi:hypothetical protein